MNPSQYGCLGTSGLSDDCYVLVLLNQIPPMICAVETAQILDSLVAALSAVMSKLGRPMGTAMSILDFGCGAGREVYRLRDCGYENVLGVDLGDYLQLRAPGDSRWFSLSLDPHVYRLPYPDNSFDLVYSTQVLEHLRFYEPALSEIRRVLKPDGVCIHIFPSKWRLIEPHFRIPFGSFIRLAWYLRLWTYLGIRPPDRPAHSSRSQDAERSWQVSRTSLNYLTLKELRFFASLSFADVRFMEKEFVEANATFSRLSRLVHRLGQVFPPIFWLYRHFHTKVMVLSGYQTGKIPVW